MSEILVLALVLFLLVVAILTLVWLFLSLASFFYTSVPYVPVPHAVAREVALIVEAHQSTSPVVFYDIGSGDGRVVSAVAEALPTSRAVGVEIAPVAYLASVVRKKVTRLKNMRTLFRNATKLSFKDATHVFMYLLPKAIRSLSKKLFTELREGTIIISCDFPITDLSPQETREVRASRKTYTLYVYKV